MDLLATDQESNVECPYSMFFNFLNVWSNVTDPKIWHGDPYYYESYVCRFAGYWAFRDRCAVLEGYSVLSLGALGFLGALFTILTLNQGHFRQLDFFLHRAVGYLELIQMADVTAMAALAYFRCEHSYVCAFVWAHVATTIANICSDAVDMIVLYLSIERTVACLLPHYFRNLHDLKTYYIVEILCLLFPAIFSMLQAFELTVFFDDQEGRYLEEPSSFSRTDLYAGVVLTNMIRFYSTAVLISIATFSSVVGFLSVERRRTKLKSTTSVTNQKAERIDESHRRQSSDDNMTSRYSRLFSMLSSTRLLFTSIEKEDSSVSHRRTRRKSASSSRNRRQTELCCLQLCLAVPVVINLILYASGLTTSHYSFITGKSVFEQNMTFEKAMKEIDSAQSFQYLRTSTNISNVLAHALHFYLYLLFSDKVRQGFVQLLKFLIPCRPRSRRQSKDDHHRNSNTGLTTANGNRMCERTQLMGSINNGNDRRKSAGCANFSCVT